MRNNQVLESNQEERQINSRWWDSTNKEINLKSQYMVEKEFNSGDKFRPIWNEFYILELWRNRKQIKVIFFYKSYIHQPISRIQ